MSIKKSNSLFISFMLTTAALLIMLSSFADAAERVNLWMAISTTAVAEYQAKAADPVGYSGAMDDVTFNTLSKMADRRVVQGLFKEVDTGGKIYKLFSINVVGSAAAKDAIDDLVAKWPAHFIMLGAWWYDGQQVGTEEGGQPLYPIHAQTYKFMPDVVVYDVDGNEVSRTPASSNADLRDVNVMTWQAFRNFD